MPAARSWWQFRIAQNGGVRRSDGCDAFNKIALCAKPRGEMGRDLAKRDAEIEVMLANVADVKEILAVTKAAGGEFCGCYTRARVERRCGIRKLCGALEPRACAAISGVAWAASWIELA